MMTMMMMILMVMLSGPPVCSIRWAVPVPKWVPRTVEQIQRERENYQEAYCDRRQHRGGGIEMIKSYLIFPKHDNHRKKNATSEKWGKSAKLLHKSELKWRKNNWSQIVSWNICLCWINYISLVIYNTLSKYRVVKGISSLSSSWW